jgi:enamine deaminase RidA (YjgF/YER057c/UK114 family)
LSVADLEVGRRLSCGVQERTLHCLRRKQESASDDQSSDYSFHWAIVMHPRRADLFLPAEFDVDYEHMSAEARLKELGISLPALPAPGGNYLSAKVVGNLLYLAGAISSDAGGVITGTAGADRSVAEGYAAARACALTQLAVLQQTLGSLDKVSEIVSVNGYVNAVAGFPDSPAVINGASDLLVAIFADAGRHVRAAVGVSALPRNALVELQMIVAV